MSSTESSSSAGSSVTFSSSFSDPASSTATTFSTDPTAPPDNSNTPDTLQSSAALYLYTFLATLILLLGVSAAIVIRSLVLRRRHRRMIEEAIANGTWVPPAPRNRFDASQKPVMHEAYIHVDGKQALVENWDALKPFSATYDTLHPWLQRPGTPASGDADASISTLPPQRPRFWGNLFTRNTPAATPQAVTPNAAASTASLSMSSGAPVLNVSVLIAMPQEKVKDDDGDEPLPLVQVGVANVPVLAEEDQHSARSGKESD